MGKFTQALNVLASVSLATGNPTQASVPHSVANAYKAILAVTIQCENYSFDKADTVKEYLADPSKFAGSGGGGGGDAGGLLLKKKRKRRRKKKRLTSEVETCSVAMMMAVTIKHPFQS